MKSITLAGALALALTSGAAFAQTSPGTTAPASPGTAAPASPGQPARTARSPAASRPAGHLQQYKTEAEAKAACGSEPVDWANPGPHVLHPAGTRYYGKTKRGGYVCRNAALSAGYHEDKGR